MARGEGSLEGVRLSGTVFTRGDVLLVELDGLGPKAAISGTFLNQKLRFFREKKHWKALVGVSLYVDEGAYTLKIAAQDAAGQKRNYKHLIKVKQGDFGATNITLPPKKEKLTKKKPIRDERKYLTGFFTNSVDKKLTTKPAQRPVRGSVTLKFGTANNVNGKLSYYHGGTDFRTGTGTPIKSGGDGKVVLAEKLRIRGNAVLIDHGQGLISGYYHLSRLDVKPGDTIKAGQTLGASGQSGFANGPHLHWETRLHSVQVNPFDSMLFVK